VDFELEEEGTSWWSDGCDDYLKITDRDGTVLMDKTCGNNLPSPQEFKSKTNQLQFEFVADYSGQEKGFHVDWQTYDPNAAATAAPATAAPAPAAPATAAPATAAPATTGKFKGKGKSKGKSKGRRKREVLNTLAEVKGSGQGWNIGYPDKGTARSKRQTEATLTQRKVTTSHLIHKLWTEATFC
jgi:hypothetical protein